MIRVIPLIFTLLALISCSQPDQLHTISGDAQGTRWNVTVWNPAGVNSDQLEQAIQAEFERIDLTLSNYRSDSVIERFNVSTSTKPVEVGAEIVSLVESARRVSVASQGCYDLTVKPLFDLWGFTGDQLHLPDAVTLAATRQRVGFTQMEAVSAKTLRKTIPTLRVDLSSIAQGYSVGRIAAVVETMGIVDYLVEIGGELQTRGHKPDGTHWRIGVERPQSDGSSVQKALTIARETPVAVMTSGTYRHYFDNHGKRYSHVLDARTGAPVAHDTVSVTVINADPTLADAWSTALLCLGHEQGEIVANQYGIAALFIRTANQTFVESPTAAWSALQGIKVN